MRVKYAALFFLSAILAWGAPASAIAATQFYIPQAGFGMLPMVQIGYGYYQTAFKAGDRNTFRVNVQSWLSTPTISADLSQLGIPSPVTNFTLGGNPSHYYFNGVDYYPNYFFSFGPFVIGADVPDGLKTVSVTATDSMGNSATTSTQIIVDNTPPTLSLSDISFSAVPPKIGDTMYLSGMASGTGSPLTIYDVRETLLDAKGNPVWSNGGGIGYDRNLLTSAIAASADGSFSRVAYVLNDSPDNALARAASMKITVIAYDGGGHVITASLTVPTSPPPDPCAVPGACASNVLFLPGIEASRLYEGTSCGKPAEEKLWEPFESVWKAVRGVGDAKVSDLSLDPTGASICSDIYTKEGDVIDTVGGSNMYKSFLDEMNGLTAAGTIADWEPVAYDWRLSLDDLLNNGREQDGKIFYEQATSTPYIEQTLRALAASSKTKRVTIVAHSNGGLVAKALLNKLGDTEAAKLVDKVILVGVPQTGTPADIAATLVGYDAGIYQHSFPIVSNAAARALAQNSPMAYHLLPSENYLESTMNDSAHPVIRFTGAGYAKEEAAYGGTIANRVALDDFLLAKDGGRVKPLASDTASAEILNPALITYANGQHAALDYWMPPAGIEVDQIAGWGVDTVAGVDFYTLQPINAFTALNPVRLYKPITVEDGDGTVMVPSAIMMAAVPNVKRYWVDLFAYNNETHSSRSHKDLFEIPSLQEFIKNIVESSTSTLPSYISSSQPAPTVSNKKLTFFLHSPLTLQLQDSLGNVTGLGVDDSVTEGIPGSTYGEFGEVKYVTVPEGSAYQLTLHGQASGSFSLEAQETAGGIITASSTIAEVPTTASTIVSMGIQSDLSTLSPMTIDKNGDGVIDATIAPKLGDTVTLDTIPPELQLTFSTSTNALAFIATDDRGAATITTTTSYPALKKNQKKEKEDKKENEKNVRGTATTTVTARDEAGNTTALVYTEQFPLSEKRDAIFFQSLVYGSTGSPQITSPLQATMSYKWNVDKKGKYSMLATYIKTASSTIETHYQAKKNKTVIMTKPVELDDREEDNSDTRPVRQTLPGIVLPYITTQKGSLIVTY